MNRGFYTIMGAQFLSSLADNALLIAAIALLTSLQAPDWMTPLLKLFFVVSYVCLAAWVGIFADSMPKGRVMFITNFLKCCGCLLMLFGSHPLLAYAVVGVGAAAYSPAKSTVAPGTFALYSERKMAEGFVTPRSPWSVIAKTPNSFTAPKRFLKARTRRKFEWVSPSK